ncbi:unnamed protein product [Wuchereria bancrofti]|uniref:C2H2-type domain-containing protein n=1 Tax=Wuchereria bancrofti TaxID=6293 RepID=A0A3P7FR22_WUCBA|nr:unnamed protein product [Wuchereria bancrofti]
MLSSFNHHANEMEQQLSYNCSKCGYKAVDKTKGLLHLMLHDKAHKLKLKHITQETNTIHSS